MTTIIILRKPNGVAFHPSALNYNIGLKNYCQKLLKIYLTTLLLNYKPKTNNAKPNNTEKAAPLSRSGGKAGYTQTFIFAQYS